MLLLPDSINEEITAGYSKADINAIREEYEAEQQVTDLEVLMEEVDDVADSLGNDLERVMYQLGKDQPLLYRKLWKETDTCPVDEVPAAMMDVLAPSGEGMVSVRLQGRGRIMMVLKGIEKDIVLADLRSGEKESYSWVQMLDALRKVTPMAETPEESWRMVYREEFPEIAPVQQEKRVQKVVKSPEPAAHREPTLQKPEAPQSKAPQAKAPQVEAPQDEAPQTDQWEDVPEEIGPERMAAGTGKGTVWKENPEAPQREYTMPPTDAVYTVPAGKSMLKDIRGGQRFLILKMANPYRVGNTIRLERYADGEATGEEERLKVTHVVEDHGGITPGYCVLQFEILPQVEAQMPGQMSITDMDGAKE